jgi:hypothetical protein
VLLSSPSAAVQPILQLLDSDGRFQIGGQDKRSRDRIRSGMEGSPVDCNRRIGNAPRSRLGLSRPSSQSWILREGLIERRKMMPFSIMAFGGNI